MLKSWDISSYVNVPGEARRFRRAFSHFSALSLSDTHRAQSSLVGGTAGSGDEIALPLAISLPLYQYSLRPGHCLTIFPYLLRYSAYIFIISFFVGVYHAQDKTIISIIFCIVNVNKKGGFTALLTRKADYLLIFSSSASTNSGKVMIARIVTVSPPPTLHPPEWRR